MSLLHMRIVSPAGISEGVQAILRDQRGATNLIVLAGVSHDPAGDLIQADVARECVQDIVSGLRELGVDESGSISWCRRRYRDRRWNAPGGTRGAR